MERDTSLPSDHEEVVCGTEVNESLLADVIRPLHKEFAVSFSRKEPDILKSVDCKLEIEVEEDPRTEDWEEDFCKGKLRSDGYGMFPF